MGLKENLQEAGNQIGGGMTQLLRQTGRLKGDAAETAEDVVGFDYVIKSGDKCYEFYAANPPLVGMSKPEPTDCPLGIAVFDDYAIDYKKAIDIFHTGNWGSKFTSMAISKPLEPSTNDPFWYLTSETGVGVTINANTGEVKSGS